MTKKLKITMVIIACIIIVAGMAVWLFAANEKQSDSVPADAGIAEEVQNDKSDNETDFMYSEQELREMATETAKEQFGDDAFIIFLSSEGPTELEINGIKRNIYIYAADSRNEHDKTGKIRGLYHVDADTGEIFDNGNGKMEKIKTGE